MSVSFQYLERCSAETGFQVDPLEKVVRLGELAANVARHPFLGKVLALKGGTILNLCFGPPRRLSVDLDFNYIGHIEREKMLDDRPRVEAAVAELARRGDTDCSFRRMPLPDENSTSYTSPSWDRRTGSKWTLTSFSDFRLRGRRCGSCGSPETWTGPKSEAWVTQSFSSESCLPCSTAAQHGTFGTWQIFRKRRSRS